ncbi:hypothetical protein LIP_1354 [Limnochorda pilosa]|uniref:tRNA-dihydrouridine synthase n=1 Tax=Limnochorda pilosa TaxID=1555112 RepID=A0A0K2SJE6_LIMPI|nr:hypothetical protein LIP_1354 [Limnochorda pilosa]
MTLAHPVVLAPMAGVGNLAFRLLCREQGAAMVCSEFVSARALVLGNRRSFDMLRTHPDEHPVSIQIFGSEPVEAAEAARRVEAAGADVVDFNMGCPVPKVLKAQAGVALMREPERAAAILGAMVRAVSIPVTVKMRAGWDEETINVVDLARRLEGVGVAAIAVHGRTRTQGRSGRVRWEWIQAVKEALSIPVIGNGDLFAPQDVERMLLETGCDGAMIARGALGNPWIFRRSLHYLQTGEVLPEPTPEERVSMARRHLRLLADLKGEHTACLQMREHAPHYLKGFPGASGYRARIVRAATLAEYDRIFADVLEAAGAAES